MLRLISMVFVLVVSLSWMPPVARADHAGLPTDGPACVTAVLDGNFITVDRLDHPVRLAGVVAPALGEAWGLEAQEMLAEVVSITDCRIWLQLGGPAPVAALLPRGLPPTVPLPAQPGPGPVQLPPRPGAVPGPAGSAFDPLTGTYVAWIWIDVPGDGWYLAQRSLLWHGLARLTFRPLLSDPEGAGLVGSQDSAQIVGRGIWTRTPLRR